MKELLFPHIEELDYGGLDNVVEIAAQRLYVANGISGASQVDVFHLDLTLERGAVLAGVERTAHHYTALATFRAEGREYLCAGYHDGIEIKDLESGRKKTLRLISGQRLSHQVNFIETLQQKKGQPGLEQLLVAAHEDLGTLVLPLSFFEEQREDTVEIDKRTSLGGRHFLDYSQAQVAQNKLYLVKGKELYRKEYSEATTSPAQLVHQFNSPITCLAADAQGNVYAGLLNGKIHHNGELYYQGDRDSPDPLRQILLFPEGEQQQVAFITENSDCLFLGNSGQGITLPFLPKMVQYNQGRFFACSKERYTNQQLYSTGLATDSVSRTITIEKPILTIHVGGS